MAGQNSQLKSNTAQTEIQRYENPINEALVKLGVNRCFFVQLQLLTSDYIWLLNKPYENEVTLRGQSLS